jgi:hypothetical protein
LTGITNLGDTKSFKCMSLPLQKEFIKVYSKGYPLKKDDLDFLSTGVIWMLMNTFLSLSKRAHCGKKLSKSTLDKTLSNLKDWIKLYDTNFFNN